MATVRVRGGRREAQAKVEGLERQWREDVLPLLAAARAADVEELDAKAAEARDLDVSLKAKDAELQSLESEVASFAGAQEALREATSRAKACRAALGDVKLNTLASDIKALGADPIGSLRKRRQQSAKDLETARAAANLARTELTLAEERARASKSALDAAVAARDAALTAFPEGLASIALERAVLSRSRRRRAEEGRARTCLVGGHDCRGGGSDRGGTAWHSRRRGEGANPGSKPHKPR